MAEHPGDSEVHQESLFDKVTEKLHARHDSSSSSDDEKPLPAASAGNAGTGNSPPSSSSAPSSPSSIRSKIHRIFGREQPLHIRSKIHRIFGREQPLHKVLGGGKSADIFLWRNKKKSGSVIGVATMVWFLFEVLEYHLLTLICYMMMASLAILLLWANATSFINKAPPRIPDVHIPEKTLLAYANVITSEVNRFLAFARDIATGRERKKKTVRVIGILWVLSVVAGWFNFLTLIYLMFALLFTVPVFYERYEDQVDAHAEKALIELKKHYAVFHGKVLSKVQKGYSKDKKAA